MRLKKILSFGLTMLSLALLVISCNMDYPGYKKTESGMYYKIYTKDNKDTTQVRVGSILTVHLKYGLKDSAFFDSKNSPEPIMLPVIESQYEGDFFEGVRMLRQGDSASFVLKAGNLFKTTFGQPELPEMLTDESDIYFEVRILKSQTQEEVDRDTEIRNMEMEKEEMAILEKYVMDNNIAVQPTTSGIYFIETKKGTGKAPETNGYVTAHYTVNLLGGQQLFNTRERGQAVDFKFGSQYENEGFMEVIGMMREGGRANAIVPSAMAFGAKGAGNIVPPFSTLYYDIEFIKVMSNEEFEARRAKEQEQKNAENARRQKEEPQLIEKYLKDNNITPTTILPSGLIYLEKQAGSGAKPVTGKKVKVHYTGTLIDGTKFDSSVDRGEPIEFVLGQNEVIEGWDLGIALMNVGGKATLIIPSSLAYKDRAQGRSIPPYSTLIFEVELVEAEK